MTKAYLEKMQNVVALSLLLNSIIILLELYCKCCVETKLNTCSSYKGYAAIAPSLEILSDMSLSRVLCSGIVNTMRMNK